MILISLQAIGKTYGAREILRNLDWQIEEGARLGLVGPNGSGKSTLLGIVAGSEDVGSGTIARRRDLRIAYLPQHVPAGENSPLHVALSLREDLANLEAELWSVEEAMSRPEASADLRQMERLLASQEQLIRRYEELGGPGLEGEARARLLDLGLDEADQDRPMQELSGGERKLAVLAACLGQRPDLLLLDEPETHLDLPHREQLEAQIVQFSGAVVIVSHDRYLLDETTRDTFELEGGKLRHWPGNYSAYALSKELELQRQQELYVAQQKEIERLEEAVRRFKMWADRVVNERHIRQARVKQRQIDSMEKIDRPVLERRKMRLRLTGEIRGGQKVFDLQNVALGFDHIPVLDHLDTTIMRGERVGVIGPNGTGKTLLMRLLNREIAPLGGRFWSGPSIQVGYFAQGHENLPSRESPLALVRGTKPLSEAEAVSVLMRFLFQYDQVRQPVASLSGGERSRLQLLLLMIGGANCLVLDEPTNHLDIDSLEVLESALEAYDGTVIVVSHDRYLLDRIVDRVLAVADGVMTACDGGYSDWKENVTSSPSVAHAQASHVT